MQVKSFYYHSASQVRHTLLLSNPTSHTVEFHMCPVREYDLELNSEVKEYLAVGIKMCATHIFIPVPLWDWWKAGWSVFESIPISDDTFMLVLYLY